MTFPPLDRLIPHRPPMLLVSEIVGERPEGFVCRGEIPAVHAADGGATPILGIEMGAQAAAVLQALERDATSGAEPAIGYLVSIRDARFATAVLPTERQLVVTVRRGGGFAALATFEIEVQEPGSGEILVSATLGTFVSG